jgi:Fibrobacter succinogenes major domain (Fib_succ_major).
MAENLSYETENSSCYHDSAKCVKYGRFYTWGAAVGKSEDECLGLLCDLPAEGVRGVCPQGWHLPSYDEWDDLRIAVGGEKYAGMVLSSQTGWNMTDGTDAFGFTALPGGYLWSTGTFGNDGEFAFFWSATARNEYYAYEMELGSARGYALIDEGETTRYRFSVRCIKD